MGILDFKKSYPLRTVCEVTRDLADMIIFLRNEKKISDIYFERMFNLLKEQMRMQKKMARKLCEYKQDWEEQNYSENPDHAMIEQRRSTYENL